VTFDYLAANRWISELLTLDEPAEVLTRRLIDRCAEVRPHRDWTTLASLPFGDLSGLSTWMEYVFFSEPPSEPLNGLWFGLFNPIYESKTTADLYVCGSDRFDADSDDGDWSVSPTWWPEGRHSRSEVLGSVYRIAYQEAGLSNDAEYTLCLGYASFVVRDLLNKISGSSVADRIGEPGVAVGFDSGDFVLLGRLSRWGLVSLRP
jgi:hypothetical protein